jgi:hypothetical protein
LLSMAGCKHIVPQHRIAFKIFCIYNYTSVVHIICLKACRGIKNCVQFNCSSNYHWWHFIFLSDTQFFHSSQIIDRHLQGVFLIFFIVFSKWSKYTRKGPPISLCSFIKPIM